jgi:hypothetical protein
MPDDTPKTEQQPREYHHIWCNFSGNPVEGCRQCKRLWEEYPYEPGEENGLVNKHFPDSLVKP